MTREQKYVDALFQLGLAVENFFTHVLGKYVISNEIDKEQAQRILMQRPPDEQRLIQLALLVTINEQLLEEIIECAMNGLIKAPTEDNEVN